MLVEQQIPTEREGTLPFLYEEEKPKIHYLKSTKELVANSNKFHHYYDYYRNRQNIKKFEGSPVQFNHEFPILPRLEAFRNEEVGNNLALQRQESQNLPIITSPGYKTPNSSSIKKHKKNNSMTHIVIKKSIAFTPKLAKDIWEFDFSNIDQDPYFSYQKITKEDVVSFVVQKLEYFKTNKNENHQTSFLKKFNLMTPKMVELTLKSIQIEFFNQTDGGMLPIAIEIPFPLLPVFYTLLLDIESFKQVLCLIMTFKETYEDAIVDFESLPDVIENNPRLFERKITYESLSKIPCRQKFEWITSKYLYTVIVSLPQIETYLTKLNYKILKFCDPYIVFSNLIRNFDLWSNSFRQFLSSIKQYRFLLKRIFTKIDIEDYTDYSNIFLDDTREHYYKEKKSNIFGFCFSDNERKNYFVLLRSYVLDVSHPKIVQGVNKINKVFNFKFDFEEMKLVNHIGEKWDLNIFFTRLIYLKENNLSINKKHLYNISEYLLDFIAKNCKHLSSIEDNKFVFNIENPCLVIKGANEIDKQGRIIKLSDDHLQKILDLDIKEWIYLFFENRSMFLSAEGKQGKVIAIEEYQEEGVDYKENTENKEVKEDVLSVRKEAEEKNVCSVAKVVETTK